MNILGLIFSLLLLIAYSFAAAWNTQIGATRVRSSYLGHHKAARLLVNQSESATYKQLASKKKITEKKEPSEKTKKPPTIPICNGSCAKLNLWPLVHEGKAAHPQLYDAAIRLFDETYALKNSTAFLNQLLKAARKELQDPNPVLLEKIHLEKEEDQLVYYRMLKGSKKIPSLLDYVKIDPNWQDKLCLTHADLRLLTALFGPKVAEKLIHELHQETPPALTPDLIDQIRGSTAHIAQDASALYDLILFGPPKHGKSPKISLQAEDPTSHICLKAQVFTPPSS